MRYKLADFIEGKIYVINHTTAGFRVSDELEQPLPKIRRIEFHHVLGPMNDSGLIPTMGTTANLTLEDRVITGTIIATHDE